MIVKANTGDLSEELSKLLEEGGKEIKEAVNEAIRETASEGAKGLQRGGPYAERTGKYTKDWDSKKQESTITAATGTDEYTVYNKKRYQLTHLLEKGHQSRNGGRVQPFEHIEPEEENMEISVTEKITQKLGG